MKFLSSIALASAATAAAIPQNNAVHGTVNELKSTITSLKEKLPLLGDSGMTDVAGLQQTISQLESQLTGTLNMKRASPLSAFGGMGGMGGSSGQSGKSDKSAQAKQAKEALSKAFGGNSNKQPTDYASSAAANSILVPVNTLTQTVDKTVQGLDKTLNSQQLGQVTDELNNAVKSLTGGLNKRELDMLSGVTNDLGVGKVTDEAGNVVGGVEGTLNGVTGGLGKRGDLVNGLPVVSELDNGAVGGVTGKVTGTVEDVAGNLKRGLNLGSLQYTLEAIFSKVQSGDLTPQMVLNALNVSELQSLLHNVLGHGIDMNTLESLLAGLVSRIQSGALTPQTLLSALNIPVVQNLLGGLLGGLL